jgi:hypothetical protein
MAQPQPPLAATPIPSKTEIAEDRALSAQVQLQLTKHQWDFAMVVGGAGLGDIAGGKLGAVIGAIVCVAWWRWMLGQAKHGRL